MTENQKTATKIYRSFNDAGDHMSRLEFVSAVLKENEKARTKFPDSRLSIAALMEEVGELAQAYLDFRYGKNGGENLWNEAVQVASMAMRVAVEGDRSIKLTPHEDQEIHSILKDIWNRGRTGVANIDDCIERLETRYL